MKLIFLGTNGWLNTKEGNTVSVLLKTKKYNIVFDAGDGLHKLEKYADKNKPVYIFLSHLHLDHIAGLHTLVRFNFERGLTIFCPQGTRKFLEFFLAPPFTASLNRLPYKARIAELKEGRHSRPFKFECRLLKHLNITFGYRVELEGRVVAYCSDTGPCENALILARDADILLAECSLKSGDYSEDWPHLSPETAAELAVKAKAREMGLFHFNPFVYPGVKERKQAQRFAVKIFAKTFFARDEMQVRF